MFAVPVVLGEEVFPAKIKVGQVYNKNGQKIYIQSVGETIEGKRRIHYLQCLNDACDTTATSKSVDLDVRTSTGYTYVSTPPKEPVRIVNPNPDLALSCSSSEQYCDRGLGVEPTYNPDYDPEAANPTTAAKPKTKPKTSKPKPAQPTGLTPEQKAAVKPTVKITPEAQAYMEQNGITIKDGQVYHNNVIIGGYTYTTEEWRTNSELQQETPTKDVQVVFVGGQLQYQITDQDGSKEVLSQDPSKPPAEQLKMISETPPPTAKPAESDKPVAKPAEPEKPPKRGVAGPPRKDFVQVAPGKNIPRAEIIKTIDPAKIPDKLVKPECKANLAKCTDTELSQIFNKPEARKAGVKYDPKTNLLQQQGTAVKYSDDGKYSVNEKGQVVDETGKQIGELPKGLGLKHVSTIKPNLIEFGDGSALLGMAHIPADIHKEYEGQYDLTQIDKIVAAGDLEISIPLKEDGKITIANYDSGLRAVIVVPKKGEKEEVTYRTPDGATYGNDWKLDGFTGLVKGDEKITVTKGADGHEIRKQKGGINQEVIQIRGDQTSVEKFDSDGKTTSIVVKDKTSRTVGEAQEFDDKGDVKEFEWYDKEGNIKAICRSSDCTDKPNSEATMTHITDKTVCVGTTAHCSNTANHINEDTLDDDDKCKADARCKALTPEQREEAQGDKDSADVTRGWNSFKKGFGDTMDYWNKIRRVTPSGLQSVSSWVFPETTKDMNRFASKTFDKVMLADYVVPALICDYDQAQKTQSPGSSSTFIEVAPGTVQFTGSIQAEKTPHASPMLCDEERPCSVGECINEICMEDEEILFGTFYKITWAVSAPQDEKHTPYLDENGVAVSYNIQIQGDKNSWLYPGDKPGNEYTLKLDNSASDRDTFVTYSTKDYTRVCVIFGQPPADIAGTPVNEICADFIESTQGQIDYEGGGSSSSGGSGGGGTAKAADAGRKQI